MIFLWYEIIPEIRRKLNLTQKELAEKLHIPNRSTIAGWERIGGPGRRPHGTEIGRIQNLCKENGFTIENVVNEINGRRKSLWTK